MISASSNRMVNGHQQTIVIHVNDLMITCKSQAANEEVVNKLREIYKEVSATEGKVHSYIGITFDFSKAGKVKLSQEGYTGDLVLHYKINKSVRTCRRQVAHRCCDSARKRTYSY